MTGTIEGTVTDGNGDSIADTRVTITDSATDSIEARTTTDPSGDYSVTVKADTYDVTAEKLGYDPDEETLLNVGNNETVTVNLTLSALEQKVIGELTENTGIGVVGRVDVSDGIPIGVKGQVGSPEGYGIYTPDDAAIEGSIDTNLTDFVVKAGTTTTEVAQNVILGHASNEVTLGAVGATIGGGGKNDGSNTFPNTVSDDYGTIGGGLDNTASGEAATVAGGNGNTASALHATVGGGHGNTASGQNATVGGGRKNTASGNMATVGGGKGNTAGGLYSFAAGKDAWVDHDGTFVWNHSWGAFSSTGPNQFLVQAGGGMGVGTKAPRSQLHVMDRLDEDVVDPSGHVATIENVADSGSADVLLLETDASDPGEANNYVTFADANGAVGAIEGDGNGGIEYNSGSADIAEYFPAGAPEAAFDPGTVVGLVNGEIRSDPTAGDAALVVSDASMLTGNVPAYGEADQAGEYVRVALLGQVPVRVGAPVNAGDLLVGTADGTAVPTDTREDSPPVVGRALEGGTTGDTVTTFVSARAETDHPGEMQDFDQRLADKDARIDELEAENARLRERLDAVADRLANLEDGPAEPAPADD